MMKKSLESEQEIPIEWKDPLESYKYVCDGAKIQCMFCASPGTLKATSTKIKLQDKPFATEGDKDGKVNFNFQGPCMHPSQQKPNVPPPPCKSIISLGKWMNVSKTFIGNDHALLAGSMITCSISGSPIRIIHSGQKATLDNLFKMDSPAMKMYSEEKEPIEKASEASSMLLVTSVTGKTTALVGEEVKYEVTGYNLSDVSDGDRKQVKWVVQVDGKEEVQKEQGEVLMLLVKEEWASKEITVMPYLKKPSDKVCLKTKVATCKHADGAVVVAQYIVDEIKTNTRSKIADSIRYWTLEEEYQKRYEEWKKRSLLGQILSVPESLNLLKAKALWTERVFSERPWDHKPLIRQKFNSLAVERTEYSKKTSRMVTYKSHNHKYKDYDYFYDVWSNIHYGYVGLSVGFDEKTLLGGADMAQIIDSSGSNVQDTGDDKTSIKIGFGLYYKYGRYAEGLTAQDILDALESAKMTESKKKHVCLQK